jgi:type VI secretion system protein ImpJ
MMETADRWDHHYNWGLRAFELDRDALANHRFVVRTLQLRLRDGTLVCVPEDGELPALDLRPALEREGALTVLLGVPIVHLGRANLAGPRPPAAEAAKPGTPGAPPERQRQTEGGRYLLDSFDLEDENTGLNPQPVQLRRLNLQLLLSGQDQAGYEVLPLVCLEKSAAADASPQVHLPYIPPVLACDAWAPLQQGVLQAVYDRLGRKGELLADQVRSRGISLESHAQGDSLIVGQLHALNEAYALLNVLAFARGVYPLTAYSELCRLVGQLAIFGDSRRPPELPRYDHDDLGGCFYAVKRHLDALLDQIVEPDYKSRPFEGAGLRMQVTLEPSWLEAQWLMYVGVKTTLPTADCVNMLTRGQLDMKIGSSERVDRIFVMGAAGLRFAHTPAPPRALPSLPGLIYFEVSRDSDEWQNVQRSLTLAIRLNENRVAGNIQGQRTLTVKTGNGPNVPMEFTLYVVKKER